MSKKNYSESRRNSPALTSSSVNEIEVRQEAGSYWNKRDKVPDTFKMGRRGLIYSEKIAPRKELSLFTEEELGELTPQGTPTIQLPVEVRTMDYEALMYALQKQLYNQSYLHGNEEGFTGSDVVISEHYKDYGSIIYEGTIIVTLADLCRSGYGSEPTTRQKKSMEKLIDKLHTTPVIVTYPNGVKIKEYICVKRREHINEKTKAKGYALSLSPIFTIEGATNYAELPQDTIERLTEFLSAKGRSKTDKHYKLIKLIARQDNRKPFVITMGELVRFLDMAERYRSKRSITENEICELFKDLHGIGFLSRIDLEERQVGAKKMITRVTIEVNKTFIRKRKEIERGKGD